ncbi:MAG: right-handed parallel beta-helix repeat-containing protein, partial [Planctomycetes bacterium]|nr:right-handed parallel beta-helix repeat-containing protein [Planctomycetota bacterium]
NTIRGNVAASACGGGILALSGSAPVIRDNVIEKNRACGGGGIEIDSGSALIEENVIDDNYADDGDGGGVASWASITVIDGNEVTNNLAEFDGGGIRFWNGDVTITNNQIQGNRAMPWGNGGGVCGGGQSALIALNTIALNNTAGMGGGILIAGSASIRGNVIRDNLTRSGVVCTYGAPEIDGNVIAGNKGDGVECLFTGTTPFLRENTITGNEYGGVFVDQGAAPWISGAIVYGNGTLPQDEIYIAAGTATVSWSDVRGGFSGTGNIDAPPLFVNPPAGDWSLALWSPCIDRGDPAEAGCGTDLLGTPRRLDGLLAGGERIDVGALEFSHVRLAASVDPLVPSVTIDVTGSAGLPAFLFAGLGRGETCMPPYGSFLLDGALPWILVPWGTVPSSITVSVLPQHLAFEIILQAATLAPAGGAGNTSNAAAIGGA